MGGRAPIIFALDWYYINIVFTIQIQILIVCLLVGSRVRLELAAAAVRCEAI